VIKTIINIITVINIITCPYHSHYESLWKWCKLSTTSQDEWGTESSS